MMKNLLPSLALIFVNSYAFASSEYKINALVTPQPDCVSGYAVMGTLAIEETVFAHCAEPSPTLGLTLQQLSAGHYTQLQGHLTGFFNSKSFVIDFAKQTP